MGASIALGIIFGVVMDVFGQGNIMGRTIIGMVLKFQVRWPVLRIVFGEELYLIIALVLVSMVLGVGIGMLAGFVRGRRGGGPGD